MAITSETQLVNNALIRLGANTITDLSTGGNHESNTMLQLYAPTRDALLRQHFWNFAIKRVSLAADSIAPAFEWSASYPLPADFIRVRKIFNSDGPFTIEAEALLTDQQSELQLIYVSRITDVTRFDPLFVQVLTLMLAILAAPRIQGIGANTTALSAELQLVMLEAKIVDAQDGTAEEFLISTFRDARSSGADRFDISNIL